ncbi:NRAMP-like transporter smf-3 [Podospora pseudoanserina]|uniref:NRAMP-like transporter smf-3 n=1 Tax=Podospora pseudoanserina TaxID=2609844 RepID=A0ABR0I9J5_9PEZI|nr:NRAMP-like transporter smf-3 [Podospora pseudoanserina]
MATTAVPDDPGGGSPAVSTPVISTADDATPNNTSKTTLPNPEGDALPLIRSLHQRLCTAPPPSPSPPTTITTTSSFKSKMSNLKKTVVTFAKFVGPGFMVAVAYIDPGNYATDIAAGSSYQFKLLFIVLLSNIFAIFLQALSIKLGTVSGLNLAEACRAFLPWWLNIPLYLLAEGAIIATDIAEVIGTAIAINLLIPQIPLVAGCALSITEVLLILIWYAPEKGMRGLRTFEYFVVGLVVAVVVCFCLQLGMVKGVEVGEVFRGYVPSRELVERRAMYQACGILGATVMPHSLYLGSGVVQARLWEFDKRMGLVPATGEGEREEEEGLKGYIPSLEAIRHSMKYSVAELALALFSFALFVNSAILIVAGAALYGEAVDADLFGIHDLLSRSIAPVAGTVFALALLFSGVSAGIVCTIAGQMVSEGALRWRMRPWLRRLVTRGISVVPSIVIAAAVGREGLDAALNGSQVALSVVLPFITAPLIYFTGRDRYMMVRPGMARFGGHFGGEVAGEGEEEEEGVKGRLRRFLRRGGGQGEGGVVRMGNSWWVTGFGVLVWLIITVMNVANLVLLGKDDGE